MAVDRTFQLYNTLTRRVEPVEPAEPGHLRFYSCGPTVYAYAHIGNFRSFLTADLILRTARALGWRVTYVTNITDVGHLTEDDVADASGEDKMARALQSREGERFANIYDLARHYTDALTADWHALGLREPDVRPRATEHVTDQVEAVERLVAAGHAYETPNAVYFSVASFDGYGKLSGKGHDAEALEGTRDVVRDPDKRDPRDFALWKKDPKHLMQWYSPFGRGFPGWHIECSVMAMRYLGDTIDLHAGGEDLIFPHHECEIAQSESLTGQPFARTWVHTRFLQVEGQKMSKRAGNFFTVRDLIAPEPDGRGVDPLALRLALIGGRYREPLNFTMKNLRDAARIVARFGEAYALATAKAEEDAPGDDRVGARLEPLYDAVLAAMLDDLNTPVALREALRGVKLVQGLGENLNGASARAAVRWLERINDLLGIVYADTPAPAAADDEPSEDEAEALALLDERTAARAARDFARADALRDAIEALGFDVMDDPDGSRIRRKTAF